jgi:hypothetical protein
MNPFLKYIFGDEFSHIGIILEKDGALYICEGVGKKDLYKLDDRTKGIKINDLEDRLKTYEGIICVRHLNKQLTHKMKILFKNYCEDSTKTDFCYLYDFQQNIYDIFTCIINQKVEPSCVSCSSFLIKLLKHVNLIDGKKFGTPYCYRPQIINDQMNSELNFGYEYDELMEIDIDHDKEKDIHVIHRLYA